MEPYLHSEANSLLARLRKEGINELYHFTSVENLPFLCRTQELQSKRKQQQAGTWPPPKTGGNSLSLDLDRFHNWDKVSLSLTPFIPMAYYRKREDHLCFFIVRPGVATWQGVIFTDTNATNTNHIRGEGLAGLTSMRFDYIRSITMSKDPNWKYYVQAEILVPNAIPFDYIEHVAFISNASMQYAENLCHALPHPSFVIRELLFTDSHKASLQTIGFPYVREMFLTDININENMLYSSYKNIFSKSKNRSINLIAHIRVITATNVKFTISVSDKSRPERLLGTTVFQIPDEYVCRCRVDLTDLQTGKYVLKCYVQRRCWAATTVDIQP